MQIVKMDNVRVKLSYPTNKSFRCRLTIKTRAIPQSRTDAMKFYTPITVNPHRKPLILRLNRIPPIGNLHLVPLGFQSLRQIRTNPPSAACATGYIYHQNLHIILFFGKAPPTAAPAER